MATVEEQRVVIRNVDWETYERLLADNENSSVPHLNYDCGELEIMSPLPEREKAKRAIESLVDILALELGISIASFGSTTFRREDLQRGFEADSSFYIQNERRVRGKVSLDLTVDPPPDLVIEIDITSPSLDKFPIYAQMGVVEVWRYDGTRLEIRLLDRDRYAESEESRALPGVAADAVSRLIEETKRLSPIGWLRRVGA